MKLGSRVATDDQNLEFVDASFYQGEFLVAKLSLVLIVWSVARGLVLPFTVFFSWYLLSSRSSAATLSAVGLVCVGFFLGVSSENLHASSIGVVLGVCSSVTTAVHAIVVKRSLPIVNNNTLDLVYYSNLLSAIVIAPFVLVSGEIFVVLDLPKSDSFNTFLLGVAITVSLHQLIRSETDARYY